MPITIPLLDSLLSPHPAEAESHYHSIPIESRVRELTSVLVQLSSGGTEDGRGMLAATLLRRDLSRCSLDGDVGEIAEPLMSLFEGGGGERTKRMIGRCVAELCGGEWMGCVLKRLEGGCMAMNIPHLNLLSDLADRSPLALWASNLNILSLFSGITTHKLTLNQLEAALEAIVNVGIAYEKAKRATLDGAKSDVEKALLMQFAERCTEVDVYSIPAELGRVYLPTLLQTLVGYASESADIDTISKCTSHLSTGAMQCPSLLAGGEHALTSLLQTCMSLAQLNRSDKEYTFVKLSALDVLATICSVPPIKKTIMQPNGISPKCITGMGHRPLLQFLIQGHDGEGDQRGVFALCAEHIVTGVDSNEQEWAEEPASIYDSEALWESDRTALYAESLLEAFVEILGGANALPPLFQLVDVLLANPQWQNERAVLSILERCLAAAPVTFAPHVAATVETALRLAQSTSVRVQYQALQVLGSLCIANYVGEEVSKSQIVVRENYGDRMLECMAFLAKSSSCSKVASNACLAIVSYCRGGNGSENCMIPIDKELIVPFVGPLLEALQAGPLAVDVSSPSSVSEGALTVLNRAIDAVACLADASGEDFMSFYGVMAGLKSCATFGLEKEGGIHVAPQVKNSFEVKKLRGSALEACTIVGAAVSGQEAENVEVYVQDASEIMTIATTLLNSESVDVIPMDQLLAACARIAAVMKSRYVPFLPSVLPHILKRATEKLDISITDDGTETHNCSRDGENDGYSVTVPGVGVKKVKINTTQLEEKALASRALYEHARALGKDFDSQCVEASASALLPLMNCAYSGEVRSTSSLALSQVFRCSCLAAAEDMSNTYKMSICHNLLKVLPNALVSQLAKENDDDDENRDAIADALSEVMYDVFTQESNGERVVKILATDAKELVSGIMNLIQACLSRRSVLLTEMETDAVDEDEIARCNEKLMTEAELLTHLVDSVGYQLKSLGEQFVPIFGDLIAGTLGKLLTSSGTRDTRARVSSVCLFDDCIEHCGQKAATTYAPMLLEGIAEGLVSEDEDLQSASAYGVLQIVSHAPTCLNPHTTQDLLTKALPLLDEEEQEALQVAIQGAIQL